MMISENSITILPSSRSITENLTNSGGVMSLVKFSAINGNSGVIAFPAVSVMNELFAMAKQSDIEVQRFRILSSLTSSCVSPMVRTLPV